MPKFGVLWSESIGYTRCHLYDLHKIPGWLQDRWNEKLQKIRKVQMREPVLINLTNFIEDEMVLVNDTLFSREAVGQYEEKPLKQ